MDKRELAAIVATKTGVCRADCELVIGKTFESIREAILRRERVSIRSFGAFTWKRYKPQDFLQPRDGSQYTLDARDVPSFDAVDGFRKAMRKPVRKMEGEAQS